MARLTDAVVLTKLRHVLSQWQFTGYITWKPIARQWLEQNVEGWTTRSVGEEMFRYFEARGEIDQTRETRPEWNQERYHYDFRIEIAGTVTLHRNDPRRGRPRRPHSPRGEYP